MHTLVYVCAESVSLYVSSSAGVAMCHGGGKFTRDMAVCQPWHSEFHGAHLLPGAANNIQAPAQGAGGSTQRAGVTPESSTMMYVDPPEGGSRIGEDALSAGRKQKARLKLLLQKAKLANAQARQKLGPRTGAAFRTLYMHVLKYTVLQVSVRTRSTRSTCDINTVHSITYVSDTCLLMYT